MTRQWFDDGSYLDYDDAGNAAGGMDNRGGVIPAPSVNVAQQVMDLLSLGVRSVIYSKYGANAGQPAQAAPSPAQAQQQQQAQLMTYALLAAGAFLVYKIAT